MIIRKVYITYLLLKDENEETIVEGFCLRIENNNHGNRMNLYILLPDIFDEDVEYVADLIDTIKRCV